MPNSNPLDKLSELVETNAVNAERLDEHLGEPIPPKGMIPLRRVRDYIPVGRSTVLRWAREGKVAIFRPNPRRAFVPLEDLYHAWNSCQTGE